MKKIIITSAFLLLHAAVSALADDMPTIYITYNGSEASVIVPQDATGVTTTVSGADVIINTSTNSEYVYNVSGQTDNGSFTLDSNFKHTIELNGLTLRNQSGIAFNIKSGKRTAVSIKKGTDNYIEDGALIDHKAAMYFKGHPEFQGYGTLTVKGNCKHAISAKEYLQIKRGNIIIAGAPSDGIHCGIGTADAEKNYFLMNDGTLTINNVGGDCIDSDDQGTMTIEGGTITFNVNQDGGRGMKCDTDFLMNGGTINAQLTGGSMLETNEEGITEPKRCMALNVGNNMTFTSGDINIDIQNDEAKSMKVKGNLNITDRQAQIKVTGNHFDVNPADYRYDMTVYAQLKRNGAQLTDYANYQVGAFIDDKCCGSAEVLTVQGGYTFCILRVRSNKTMAQRITFRIFDASNGSEYDVQRTVSFSNQSTQGTPSSPFLFAFVTRGDVNGDGNVDTLDVKAIEAMILEHENTTTKGDINNDGKVSISDINVLIDQILSDK